MSITYHLQSHQRHSHLKFAYVDGHHDVDFALHRHDFSELFVVTGGSGLHTVSDFQYSLKKGDIFVINGEVEHGFKNVNKLTVINLMFDVEAPFFELPSMRQLSGYQAMFKVEPIARQTSDYKAKLSLNNSQLETVQRLLETIKDEYEQALPGFELILTSLMQQLVASLARTYQEQMQHVPQTTLSLSRALVFIEQNFTQVGINSADIAQAAFISQRQLERLFRRFLNTTPNRYLKDTQLNYAAKLLGQNHSLRIQQAAEQCGFADSNYFSKCFSQKFKLSPRAFRSTHILHRAYEVPTLR